MTKTKSLLRLAWAGFFLCIVVLGYQSYQMNKAGVNRSNLALEFAPASEVRAILADWDAKGVLQVAVTNTYTDFFFIFFYVLLLGLLSARWREKETRPALRALLMLSIPLIIIASLLDVVEDLIILKNIHHYLPEHGYTSSYAMALPKFILAGIAVAVWLYSALTKRTVPARTKLNNI
jgi:hypothetical protein